MTINFQIACDVTSPAKCERTEALEAKDTREAQSEAHRKGWRMAGASWICSPCYHDGKSGWSCLR